MSVLFENAQWRVTDKVVETRSGSTGGGQAPWYEFGIGRLLETTDRERTYYDWPVHMAEKTWVDIDLFIEAFRFALEVHKDRLGGTVDIGMLEASVQKAQRDWRHYNS